jgi:hypothetical protein
MKLIISRTKRELKGAFGGSKGTEFVLRYSLELTQEETKLVDEYALRSHALTISEIRGVTITSNTIGELVKGRISVVSDLAELIRDEMLIKEACDGLPALFEFCKSFNIDQAIEYPRNNDG